MLAKLEPQDRLMDAAPRNRLLNNLEVLAIILGFVGGDMVGQAIGSNFTGMGQATGQQIGGWIGWSIGCPSGMVACFLLSRLSYFQPNERPRFNSATLAWMWIFLFAVSVAGTVGSI